MGNLILSVHHGDNFLYVISCMRGLKNANFCMWCRLKKWNMISKNCDFFGIRISKFEKNAIGVSQSPLFGKIVKIYTIF